MTVARWVGVSKAKHKTWTRKSTVSVLLSDVALGPDLLVRRGLVRSGWKPEANPVEDGRRSQTLDRIILGFCYSPRGWRVPKGFLMLKNLKLLSKLTEREQGECDGCVTQAEGQLPDKTHPAVSDGSLFSRKRIKASWDEDSGTICHGKSG